MLTKFVVGRWYRWIGPTPPTVWSIPPDASREWVKGAPHLCTERTVFESYRFEGIHSVHGDYWQYGRYVGNFEEVDEWNL